MCGPSIYTTSFICLYTFNIIEILFGQGSSSGDLYEHVFPLEEGKGLDSDSTPFELRPDINFCRPRNVQVLVSLDHET